MDLNKVEEILKEEPAFRLKQIKKAIFIVLIKNWSEVTTLPQNLRQELSENCPLSELKAEKILSSEDNQTVKALFALKDGLKIESVLMRHIDKRRTICVSSQVGCPINCKFCATGESGFRRNLLSSEIIEQVLYFARLLKKDEEKVGDEVYAVARVTNVVFMCMGEPFLNYDNVLEAVRILNDKEGFNFGARHISISTCGITEGIERLAKEKLQTNLAISLNAPNNELRTKLMPINEKYPIEKILGAVDNYIKKTKRRVMFEYLMIDGVNDSPIQAKELAKLLKKPLYFVNLISFNPIGHCRFKPSPGWKIKKFKEVLEKSGLTVTQRYRFGQEIKGACGQLAGKNNL